MITNADVTIYNKYFDKATRTDKYKRTVLKGVFWDHKKAVNMIKSGMENAHSVSIMIPFSMDTDKSYISPKEFYKSPGVNNFTLSEGDRVVKGIIDFEITGKVSDLDKDYEAFTIVSVDPKDFGSPHMQHWEISAR